MLAGSGLGRGLAGVGADGVAGEDEFYATILLAAFGGVVAGDGCGLAVSMGFDGGGVNALLHKVIANGLRAAFGELLVVIVGADAIGIAFDGDVQCGIGE